MRVQLVSRISLCVRCSVFVLAAVGFLSGTASAQDSGSSALPADIHPDSLSRLPLLSRDDLDAEGKAAFDHVVGDGEAPRTGPVPASFYSPAIARSWHDLNSFIRYNGDLSPRHTEVAILVAAWEIEQQYEWSAHEPAALRFGAPQAVIDTIKYDREPAGLSPEETVIIRLGRQLLRERKVDSDLYAEAVRLFGEKGLVEMVTTMGDYVMVGLVLTTVNQQLPPDRPALLPPR